MADNTTFQTTLASPPSGLVIATDDVTGVHFQKVKIDVGGDGASAMLSNSNPLPVSDAGGSLTVDGTVTATLSGSTLAGQTAVTADYDSGGGTQNLAMLGLALPGSGGAVAGGTFTNPIRIDPTATTAQPVTDNGGSLTIDGSVGITGALPTGNNNIGDVDVASIAAGDNLIGRMKLTDGTTVADVFDYTNSNPLAVRLTDTNGDYVSAGAGTQYTEDVASTADPVGGMNIARRRDTLSGTEVSADGDNIALNATGKGELYVKHVDTIPVTDNGGTLSIDDGAGSITVDGSVTLGAGTANIGDVDVLSVPAPLNLTGGGVEASALRVTLASDSTGVLSVDDNGSSLTVDDGGGSLTIDGTVTVNALPAGSNNIGDVDILTVPAPLNVTGGGAETTALRVTLASDSTGLLSVDDNAGSLTVDAPVGTPLFVRLSDGASAITTLPVSLASLPALAAGTNNIGDVDVLSVPAPLSTTGNGTAATALRVTVASDSTGVIAAAGQVAHDSPVSGNPVMVAGEARSTEPTAVASGDVSRMMLTLLGKQLTLPYAMPGSTWNYAAASGGIVNTTGVTAKAAAGAGVRNYITSIQIINGHASVDTDVQIRDGAAGTVLFREFAKSGGGGISCKCDPPLRGTANTLIEIACGTTGSAVYVNLQGYVAAE